MSQSNSLFIRALRGEAVERTPVWLMRQAGRYLPEYRTVRADHEFLEMCRRPELASEVTLQPIRRFGLDAAIIFSDILLVIDAMGAGVRFDESGPIIDNPVAGPADVRKLRPIDPERDLGEVAEAIRMTVAALPEDVPLIGFAGAPFTLLSYLVGGRGERGISAARAMILREPETARLVLDKLTDAVAAHLESQVRAGARAVQLFDTWAGTLNPSQWSRFAAPYARRALEGAGRLGVPTIYFARGTALLLPSLAEVGADCYGVDWLCDLAEARRVLGPRVAVQGNLDPAVLQTSPEVVRAEAAAVLEAGRGPGHVFNLGHGVMPQADPELVRVLVEAVRGDADATRSDSR